MSEDYTKIKRRVKTVEEAMQLLTDMARRADERMDDFDASLSNLTVKVEALADAQIRTEETLTNAQESLTAKVAALVDAQIRIEETLMAKIEALAGSQESLTAKLETMADAQIRTQESLTRLADAQANLAEAQAHTDQRLDALIDIVREGRNGQ